MFGKYGPNFAISCYPIKSEPLKPILILTLTLLFSSGLSAQYIYYRERNSGYINKESSTPAPEPKQEQPPVKEYLQKAEKEEAEKPVVEQAAPEKVYKTYPDKCPGVEGSIPWCLSYVPELLIKILVDRYEGYLMTIKGIRQEDGSTLYYCQICSNGTMRTEYANEDGVRVVK